MEVVFVNRVVSDAAVVRILSHVGMFQAAMRSLEYSSKVGWLGWGGAEETGCLFPGGEVKGFVCDTLHGQWCMRVVCFRGSWESGVGWGNDNTATTLTAVFEL